MTFFDTIAFLIGFGGLGCAAATLRESWRLRASCRQVADGSRLLEQDLRDAANAIDRRDQQIAGLRAALAVAMNRRGVS